ncbi:MAG: hypothetical protein EP335_15765 [Alphaproteobacteria bacterium]|nr:MAG: hypothetical protein EP335_15765 [Alphaproteobacteria bacterium]
MKFHTTKILASLLLGGTTITSAAYAQDATAEGDAVKSVYERYRADYDAPGVRSGSFLFYPKVEGGMKYDSNIYVQESNVTDDFIAVVKPSFSLVSDWNSSYFALKGGADIGRYLDNGTEDYEDFNVAADARKDIAYGTDFHGSIGYADKHEDRGSPDVVGSSAEQTTYSQFDAAVGFKRDVSIMSFAVDASYKKLDYSDTAKVGGGTINNDDRDRERYGVTARLGYELADGYEAFLRLTGDRIKYDNSKEDGGPQRNSDGQEAVVGAAFDLTGKAKGEFFAGYMRREYDSETLGTTDGFNFGASLLWNPTGLTSVIGTVKRSIEESTLGGPDDNGDFVYASGYVATLFSLRFEHELQRNVLLSAGGSYTRMAYQRLARDDDQLQGSAGIKYLLNPNLNVNASYKYDYRDSSIQGADYSRHSFMVGLTGQW